MSVIDLSGNSGSLTIPTDLGEFPFTMDAYKALSIIRECGENASNYNANNMYVCNISVGGEKSLVVAHDGLSFIDLHDIADNGLIPNLTKGEGASLQGCGLYQSAAVASIRSRMKLIIASHCKNGKFVACEATPSTDGHNINKIARQDVTPFWHQTLDKLYGSKWFNTYKVFYIFRWRSKINIDGMLNPATANVLPYMTGIVANRYSCGEKKGEQTSPGGVCISYATSAFHLDAPDFKNVADRFKDGGSYKRQIPSAAYYKSAFSDTTFEVDSKFKVCVDDREDIHWNCRAKIEFTSFPGFPSDADNTWLGNIRDGNDFGFKFKKNKGSGYDLPILRGFLLFSYLATCHEIDLPELDRFGNNAVYFMNSPKDLMNEMGLRYQHLSRKRRNINTPFVVVIVRITNMVDCATNNTVSFHEVSDVMKRRADFLFNNNELARRIMMEASKNADPKQLEKIRPHFDQMFPQEKEGWLDLVEPEPVKRGGRFQIIDMETGTRMIKLRKKGETPFIGPLRRYFSILNTETGQFVQENEISWTHSVDPSFQDKPREAEGSYRIDVKDAEEVIACVRDKHEADPIIFACVIRQISSKNSATSRIETITPDEYDPTDPCCLPNRVINLQIGEENDNGNNNNNRKNLEKITLMRLERLDDPDSTDEDDPDSAKDTSNEEDERTVTLKDLKGEGIEPIEGGENKQSDKNPGSASKNYRPRDPDWFLGEYDPALKRWFWNSHNGWVEKEYYNIETDYEKNKKRDLYNCVNGMAQDFHEGSMFVRVDEVISPPEISDYAADPDPFDLPFNIYLKSRLLNDPYIVKILDEIEKQKN